MSLIQEALINGVIGVVVALITVLASGARQFILAKAQETKANKSETEWTMIQSIAQSVVMATEQIAKALNIKGKQKYTYAIQLLEKELSERGIKLSDSQKKTLIEAGVKGMNEVEDAIIDAVTK